MTPTDDVRTQPNEAEATPLWALPFLLSAQCVDAGFQLLTLRRTIPHPDQHGAHDLTVPEAMDCSDTLFA